jgi:hypothetical protein
MNKKLLSVLFTVVFSQFISSETWATKRAHPDDEFKEVAAPTAAPTEKISKPISLTFDGQSPQGLEHNNFVQAAQNYRADATLTIDDDRDPLLVGESMNQQHTFGWQQIELVLALALGESRYRDHRDLSRQVSQPFNRQSREWYFTRADVTELLKKVPEFFIISKSNIDFVHFYKEHSPGQVKLYTHRRITDNNFYYLSPNAADYDLSKAQALRTYLATDPDRILAKMSLFYEENLVRSLFVLCDFNNIERDLLTYLTVLPNLFLKEPTDSATISARCNTYTDCCNIAQGLDPSILWHAVLSLGFNRQLPSEVQDVILTFMLMQQISPQGFEVIKKNSKYWPQSFLPRIPQAPSSPGFGNK